MIPNVPLKVHDYSVSRSKPPLKKLVKWVTYIDDSHYNDRLLLVQLFRFEVIIPGQLLPKEAEADPLALILGNPW